MFKNIRNTILSLVTAVTLVSLPVAVPVMVSAAAPDIQACTGQGTTLSAPPTGGNCTGAPSATGATTKVNDIIRTVINIFSFVVGVVSVIMIILGGFKYVTSGGDSNNVSSAKNTIIYALIGLVIVALSQFIVQFVLTRATAAGSTTG